MLVFALMLLIEFIVVGIVIFYTKFKAEKEIVKEAENRKKEAENRKYNFYDKLLELQNLKEKNIITEEEFEEEKKKFSNN